MQDLRKRVRRASEALDRRRDDALDQVEALDLAKASDEELEQLIAGLAAIAADDDQDAAIGRLRKVAAKIGSRRRPWKSRLKFNREAIEHDTERARSRYGARRFADASREVDRDRHARAAGQRRAVQPPAPGRSDLIASVGVKANALAVERDAWT